MYGPRIADGSGPDLGLGRRARAACAAAALALGLVVGAPWLSGSASASTGAPFASEPSDSPSPEPSPSEPSPSSSPSVDPSCSTSSGATQLPDPLPSGWSLPPWVSSSDGPVCAVLDVSALRDTPESPDPEPEPSSLPDSQQLAAILSQLEGLRSLVLYSGGLLIFCVAGLFYRSRRA